MCVYWVLSAKQAATRERGSPQLVADCAAGQLIKPLRYDAEPAWAARLREQLGSC